MASALVAANWIQERARTDTPVALDWEAVTGLLHFYDGEEAVQLAADEAGRAALVQMLTGAFPVSLVVRSLPMMTDILDDLTGLPRRAIVERIAGDMEAIDYVLGTAHKLAEPAAVLSTWLAVREMQLPPYYARIAVPRQRLRALPQADGEAWSVTYPNLFGRVAAKYTMEPALLREIETHDPVESLADALRGEVTDITHDRAYGILIEQLMGSADYERALPVLAIQVRQTEQRARTEGKARTLYGRVMPVLKETPLSDIMWHTIAGTVEDIVNVAAVTLANQGASVHIPPLGSAIEERISLHGSISRQEKHAWIRQLVELAALGEPLSPIRLDPVVVT